ncbi:hypothetical protein FQN51_007613 [Onygenales sp. PD_10]|nr:hypothetical protein FQN51_007613 [Onygenales sp. PD_10]
MPIRRPLCWLTSAFFPLNFITLHYAYFICLALLSSLIFWGSSTPPRSIQYTDALFLTTSALTLSGLNTVDLSALNTFQQCILFLLTILGSAILVSSVVISVRRKAFETKFRAIVREQKRLRRPSLLSLSEQRRGPSLAVAPSIDRVSVSETNPDPGEDSSIPLADISGGPLISGAESTHTGGDGNSTTGDAINFSAPPEFAHPEDTSAAVHNEAILIKTSSAEVEPHIEPHITFDQSSHVTRNTYSKRTYAAPSVFSVPGVGARHDLLNHPSNAAPQSSSQTYDHIREGTDFNRSRRAAAYLGVEGLLGRNSQFYGLTTEDRFKLGGVEYRALSLLAWVVPLYLIVWQLFGAIAIGAWVANHPPESTITKGLNLWWVGIFNAISAFNNNGMSLLDVNMIAFQTSAFMLLSMGLLILAGNTCYPIFLRLILWTWKQLLPSTPTYHDLRITLKFLVDHPRRCYTHLFPSAHTWWLLGSLIMLNGVDWIMFEILNIGNPSIESFPALPRALDGLFQALAVRSGGFYVVTIASLRKSLLVLYVLMMYISVYPVVITMRNSNVYEERSLGIFPSEDQIYAHTHRRRFIGRIRRTLSISHGGTSSTPPPDPDHAHSPAQPRGYFVRQQLRSQLAHDLWWIALAVFLISIVENHSVDTDPVNYSVFNIIFEVISGYGCVGISVGLPTESFSFCGGWHRVSKLILCAVMIRGRHRGLPVAIDHAVLLPGEHLGRAEEEDAIRRVASAVSVEAGGVEGGGGWRKG